MIFVPMATVKGRDGIDVGRLACEATLEVGLSHKEAAILQGYPDASQWSKALKGGAPLDLWAMRHLPNKWWHCFLQKFASALIKRLWEDLTADHTVASELAQVPYRMAKADVHPAVEERKRA